MEEFIETRGTTHNREAQKNFMFVTYQAPKKKGKQESPVFLKELSPKKSKINKDNMKLDLQKEQQLEMKRARFEVMKFGISGFTKPKAKKAKIALAINLGAKPPSNKRKNYKEILEEKKAQKARTEKKISASGYTESLKKPKLRRERKKDSGILGVYGKVQKKNT